MMTAIALDRVETWGTRYPYSRVASTAKMVTMMSTTTPKWSRSGSMREREPAGGKEEGFEGRRAKTSISNQTNVKEAIGGSHWVMLFEILLWMEGVEGVEGG